MAFKAELRKTYLTQRQQLTAAELSTMSQQIAQQFFAHFSPEPGDTVHAFLPIRPQNEVDTWPIIKGIWENHPKVQVVVPIAHSKDLSLTHHLLSPDTVLVENKLGIPEPLNALPVPESEIAIAIIPLLAYDQQGNRVGYGRGFYDRFLSLLPSTSLRIGVSFSPPEASIDDINAQDLPLDAVITPEKVWDFTPDEPETSEKGENEEKEDSLEKE